MSIAKGQNPRDNLTSIIRTCNPEIDENRHKVAQPTIDGSSASSSIIIIDPASDPEFESLLADELNDTNRNEVFDITRSTIFGGPIDPKIFLDVCARVIELSNGQQSLSSSSTLDQQARVLFRFATETALPEPHSQVMDPPVDNELLIADVNVQSHESSSNQASQTSQETFRTIDSPNTGLSHRDSSLAKSYKKHEPSLATMVNIFMLRESEHLFHKSLQTLYPWYKRYMYSEIYRVIWFVLCLWFGLFCVLGLV